MEVPEKFATNPDPLWHKANIAELLNCRSSYMDELQEKGIITPQYVTHSQHSFYTTDYVLWACENVQQIRNLYNRTMSVVQQE